jgi:hypothetical protein
MTNLAAQLIAGVEWAFAVMLIGASMCVLWLLAFDCEDAPPEVEADFERHLRGVGR